MTKKKRRGRRRRRFRGARLVVVAVVAVLAGAIALVAWERLWLRLPALADRDAVRVLDVPLSGGGERELVLGPESPYWTPLGRVAESLRRCVVRAEDARFWEHRGFDWIEIRNSFEENLREKRLARGGSTITMQLAKNLFLWREKSLARKGIEAYLAWRLETTLTKDRILELYLNVVEWGSGVYGIGEASHHYFGKPPAALTMDESALLASILPSPVAWSPDRSPASAWERKRELLERLGGSC